MSGLTTVMVWDLSLGHIATPGPTLRSKTLYKTRSKFAQHPWLLCLSVISTKPTMSLQALLWDPRPYPKPDPSSHISLDHCACLWSQPSSQSHSKPCSEIQDLIHIQIQGHTSALAAVLDYKSQPSSQHHFKLCSENQDLIQNQIRAHTSALVTVLVCDLNQAHNVTLGITLRSKTISKTKTELRCQAWPLCWSEISSKDTLPL